MFGGIKDAMNERARESCKTEVEEKCKEVAPGFLACLFPCCGGPIGTIDKCMCVIPADQKDDVKSGIAKYKELSEVKS